MASCWRFAQRGAWRPAVRPKLRPGAADAAARGGGGAGDIWFLRMDRAGGEAFQIPGVGGAPIFSPDNRWIAFLKATPPPRSAHEATPLERQLEQRFKGRIYDWMNVRADGRGFLPDPRDPAATPPAELYVVARDGGTARQLTHLGVDVREPAWRPDSAALALVADSHARDEYSYERADLWTVSLDGEIHRLTDDGFEYDSPAWSPDGATLVFRRRQSLSQIIANQAEARRGGGSISDGRCRRPDVEPHRRVGSDSRRAHLSAPMVSPSTSRPPRAAIRKCIA